MPETQPINPAAPPHHPTRYSDGPAVLAALAYLLPRAHKHLCDGAELEKIKALGARLTECNARPRDLGAELAELIGAGLTIGQATDVFCDVQKDHEDPRMAAYIDALETSDELELAGSGIVSPGADPGAWVLAWAWVSDDDAGLESEADEDEGEG